MRLVKLILIFSLTFIIADSTFAQSEKQQKIIRKVEKKLKTSVKVRLFSILF